MPEDIEKLKKELEKCKADKDMLELAEFSINKSYEEVFWIDKDAKIIRVNDYACKMLGYKKEELLKMTVHDIDPVFTKDLWPKHWEDLKKNKSQVIKSIHKTKEGKEYPVEISINYLNYNGREYNFAYAKDISQRECALQRLKDAEEKYRTFLENLIGIYYKANINGIPVLFEGTVKDITGYDKEEFIKGLSWDKIIHPEDFKNMKDSWELLAKAPNTSVNREYRIIRKDGAVRWLHEITRNICENNKPKYLIGSLHDITEKRLIQDEIGQAKEDAEEYLEIAANIIVAIDTKGKITLLNKNGHKLLGYKEKELIGKNWFNTCLPKEQRDEVKKVFQNCMEGKLNLVQHYDNPIMTKDGSKKIIRWYNTYLKDKTGNIIGTLSSGQDITEKQKIDELKSNILRDVSHELKTPASLITYAARKLKEQVANGELNNMHTYLRILNKNADRLNHEISSILEMGRLETTEDIAKDKVNVCSVISGVVNYYRDVAARNHNKIIYHKKAECIIKGNENLLKLCVSNLIDNSAKFTRNGKISVSLLKTGKTVTITVKDTGKGIGKNKLKYIFNPFVKVDQSSTGIGLGLSICKKIVDLHKGQIKVKSVHGKGTEFKITLPRGV